jgi:hypothetical protein
VNTLGFKGKIPVALNPERPFAMVATVAYALSKNAAKSSGRIILWALTYIIMPHSLWFTFFSGPKKWHLGVGDDALSAVVWRQWLYRFVYRICMVPV